MRQGMPASAGPSSPVGPAALRATANPARQASIRTANLALLYRLILDAPAPVSRAALAAATGVTRATASALADSLLAAHLVAEVSPPPATGAGRPAAGLVPDRDGPAGLGLEVNVDYLAACVVDLTGAVRSTVISHGDQRGRAVSDVLADLAALAREATAGPRLSVAGAAVAVPGLVEAPDGRIRQAPNLAWQDLEIGLELRRLLPDAPFEPVVGNEADFAALAEAHSAAGQVSTQSAGTTGTDTEAHTTAPAIGAGHNAKSSALRADTPSASATGTGSHGALPAAGTADSAKHSPRQGSARSASAKHSAQQADARSGISTGAEGRAATAAEPAPAPTTPLTDFLYISGEIGVGAGIILDREPFRGARGWAGEIGHVTVEPDGAPCRCGARGCLETVAGLEALRRNGPEAAAPALGRAVAAAVNLLDLPAVVLGGVYARPEFAALVPGVERALSEHVVFARWAPVTVRVSRLGTAAAAAGAATAVVRRVHADPAAWTAAC